MNSRRLFYGLVGLLVVISGLGVFVLVQGNKMLTQKNDHLTQLKLESSSLEQVQNSLVNAKKDITQYSEIEQIAKTVVPQEKDQARTVREIVKLAEDSNIAIASVTFPSSTLGNKASAGSSGSSTNSSTSTATQTQKVDGITGVERLEITITSESTRPVTFNNFLSFLEKLEQNRRTSQVANINIQPVPENRNLLTFTLILNVYIKK